MILDRSDGSFRVKTCRESFSKTQHDDVYDESHFGLCGYYENIIVSVLARAIISDKNT